MSLAGLLLKGFGAGGGGTGAFSTTARNQMLDDLTVNQISLHSGDPGAAGTANEITGGGYARQTATIATAGSGVRVLSADVSFSGPASQAVTHMCFWNSTGSVFHGSVPSTGDAGFNAAGTLIVTAAGTSLGIS